MNGFIRKTLQTDLPVVAREMRRSDALEVWRHNRTTPLEALKSSAARSAFTWTFMCNGKPCAVFGLVPDSLLSSKACIWLLGTDQINRCKLSYFKACRRMVARILQHYPVLYNYVDAEYKAAHKWLEALGAEFLSEEPYGVAGEVFKFFVIRRK